ncbi:Detected protein of unknown function [Hibiscus syriacus]|uniref:Phospholipase A1 n=1 Tax=Hibiscus syriacus TaxID=106335 RepID=A0A6A3BR75_HIBSY|nr:Detected protein of unknown function [Hibiscus syriacus]
MGSIATRRRELSGESNWEDLLHPLDSDLRRYIIHYGERVGSVGDLYDDDTGKPDASKENFFEVACLIKGNKFKYVVTHFLYADSESEWFGYVAVTPDDGKAVVGRRDILVAWRGTKTDTEWIHNANCTPKRATELFGPSTEAMVQTGFLSLYTSARTQLGRSTRDSNCNGHSGQQKIKSSMVTAFVYGGPRVGTTSLKNRFTQLGNGGSLHLLRIQNSSDPVPKLPNNSVYDYTHVGEELMVDTSKSDYMKCKDSCTAHDLNVYLHGVAGVQEQGFRLAVDLDIALMDKYLDCLNDTKIPPKWWDVDENRRKMVQKDGGHWEKK